MEQLLKDLYQWVQEYIQTFYTDDPDIQSMMLLKQEHTKYVVKISGTLAAELKLSEHDRILAEMIGLFHDIGRFKQYSIYRTFNDHLSENHALLGLKEIANLQLLTRLSESDSVVFRFAIANHNAMCVAETKDARALLFAKIIRDADKLDIYRVLSPLLRPSDGSGYNPTFSDGFLRGEQCDYTAIRTQDDRKLVRLLWMYDVYFAWTMRKIIERGYIDEIVKCLPQTEVTAQGVKRLRVYMKKKAVAPELSEK